MSVRLYGVPESTFVWTVRLLLHEKAIPHDLGLEGADGLMTLSRSPDLALHPFRKIPILEHDGRRVFETSAICRYLDRVFDGPSFTPEDPYAAAMNDQWMSAVATYVDRALVREFLVPLMIGTATGTPMERTAIARALRNVGRVLDVLEDTFKRHTCFLGDDPVLADFFLWPPLHYLGTTPFFEDLATARPRVAEVLEAARTRASFKETSPAWP